MVVQTPYRSIQLRSRLGLRRVARSIKASIKSASSIREAFSNKRFRFRSSFRIKLDKRFCSCLSCCRAVDNSFDVAACGAITKLPGEGTSAALDPIRAQRKKDKSLLNNDKEARALKLRHTTAKLAQNNVTIIVPQTPVRHRTRFPAPPQKTKRLNAQFMLRDPARGSVLHMQPRQYK